LCKCKGKVRYEDADDFSRASVQPANGTSHVSILMIRLSRSDFSDTDSQAEVAVRLGFLGCLWKLIIPDSFT